MNKATFWKLKETIDWKLYNYHIKGTFFHTQKKAKNVIKNQT